MENLEIQNNKNINDFKEQLKILEMKHILNIKDVYNLMITKDQDFYYVVIDRNRLRKSK